MTCSKAEIMHAPNIDPSLDLPRSCMAKPKRSTGMYYFSLQLAALQERLETPSCPVKQCIALHAEYISNSKYTV